MDRLSARIAGILAGNDKNEAVIEIHFPSSEFFFEDAALICVAGADFSAHINGEEIPLAQPVLINRYSILQFYGVKKGARAYLSVHGGFKTNKWLNSYSTNIKAATGGFGRALRKEDEISLVPIPDKLRTRLGKTEFEVLPWKADNSADVFAEKKLMILHGNEWSWLKAESQKQFLQSAVAIGIKSDRMGYSLAGVSLLIEKKEELISSAVSFGTIQLLPSGQMIVLMADHQTTGGYPRIAHVISAHLPLLAQKKPGDKIEFEFTDHVHAESMFSKQQQHLLQLENACKFRLEKYLYEN